MVKPLLLLDIDGVLNPLHAGDLATDGPADEPHFATFTGHLLRHPTGKEAQIRLSAAHGEWLLGLADIFDLAWATTWGAVAQHQIADIVGLPTDLPCAPIPARPNTSYYIDLLWKTPLVLDHAAGRPVAWVDDQFTSGADAWALTRIPQRRRHQTHSRRLVPAVAAITVRVNPRWGLRPQHVEALRTWGQAWARIDTPDLHAAIAEHLTLNATGQPACGCPDWAQLSDEERLNLPASPVPPLADLVERDWPEDVTASALHHY